MVGQTCAWTTSWWERHGRVYGCVWSVMGRWLWLNRRKPKAERADDALLKVDTVSRMFKQYVLYVLMLLGTQESCFVRWYIECMHQYTSWLIESWVICWENNGISTCVFYSLVNYLCFDIFISCSPSSSPAGISRPSMCSLTCRWNHCGRTICGSLIPLGTLETKGWRETIFDIWSNSRTFKFDEIGGHSGL